MRPVPVLLAALACALAAAGCGGASRDDAVDVATSWLEAVREGDTGAACELMAPTATRNIAAKYLAEQRDRRCPAVVGAYRRAVGEDKLGRILDEGLEYEGDVTKGRLGVFPALEAFQFEVVLMDLDGEDWRVASSGIAPAER